MSFCLKTVDPLHRNKRNRKFNSASQHQCFLLEPFPSSCHTITYLSFTLTPSLSLKEQSSSISSKLSGNSSPVTWSEAGVLSHISADPVTFWPSTPFSLGTHCFSHLAPCCSTDTSNVLLAQFFRLALSFTWNSLPSGISIVCSLRPSGSLFRFASWYISLTSFEGSSKDHK